MGSFSIWHWLIVLILLLPIIIGIVILGFQKSVILKHTQSGLTKNGYLGFSWTYALFGWFVPVIRGEIGIGVLHLILTFCTFGIFQIIMACFYNRQNITRLLTNGWEICDSDEVTVWAKNKLAIVN